MRIKYILLALFLFASANVQAAEPSVASCPEVLNVRLHNLNDEPANLCDYAGQVVLVVNTASYCGFTPQYKALETLYRNYHARGLMVLGFPSNDFGNQEPGSNKEIAKFCKLTYGVEFPMLEKATITSEQPTAPYPALIKATGQKPQWNFHKYLISRDGKSIRSFASDIKPDSPEFIGALEAMLKAN
ncbi:MAG: glutathione peroxidase [Gallionella sp.]